MANSSQQRVGNWTTEETKKSDLNDVSGLSRHFKRDVLFAFLIEGQGNSQKNKKKKWKSFIRFFQIRRNAFSLARPLNLNLIFLKRWSTKVNGCLLGLTVINNLWRWEFRWPFDRLIDRQQNNNKWLYYKAHWVLFEINIFVFYCWGFCGQID